MEENIYLGSEEKKNISIGLIIGIVMLTSFFIFGTSYITTYNDLVELEEDVIFTQANVQVMMQRRLELIPDLVETTKAASAHIEKVHELENAVNVLNSSMQTDDVMAIDEANKALTVAIDSYLDVVIKNYPEVTASEQYISLMDQIEGSVNRISIARENYNEVVSSYNRTIRRFPGSIIASMFGFEKIEPFKADKEANNTNMVDFD